LPGGSKKYTSTLENNLLLMKKSIHCVLVWEDYWQQSTKQVIFYIRL